MMRVTLCAGNPVNCGQQNVSNSDTIKPSKITVPNVFTIRFLVRFTDATLLYLLTSRDPSICPTDAQPPCLHGELWLATHACPPALLCSSCTISKPSPGMYKATALRRDICNPTKTTCWIVSFYPSESPISCMITKFSSDEYLHYHGPPLTLL